LLIRIRAQESGAFLTLDPEQKIRIRDGKIRSRDEKMRIRDGKIRIGDQNPGSATLLTNGTNIAIFLEKCLLVAFDCS